MEKFTRTIFAEYLEYANDNHEPSEMDTIKGVNFNDVVSFILALVIPSYVKRNMKFTPTYTTYDTFYEWLYRYSHKRLEAALSIPAVAVVFEIFLNWSIFENLLENDTTLSKNREAYESAKSEFLEIIEKKIKLSL